jgi:cell wall-associated NlpC family hydrolase
MCFHMDLRPAVHGARGTADKGTVALSPPALPVCLAIALAATMAAGCASSGARPRPFPAPAARVPPSRPAPLPAHPPGPPPSPLASAVVADALALAGTPYRNGGADPRGFDCSGLVQYVFARHGVAVPRTVREQAAAGRAVDAARVVAGDLLFFATKGEGPSHVAIAIDGRRFVHAPNQRGVVRVEHLAGDYWPQRFLGARRVGR